MSKKHILAAESMWLTDVDSVRVQMKLLKNLVGDNRFDEMER